MPPRGSRASEFASPSTWTALCWKLRVSRRTSWPRSGGAGPRGALLSSPVSYTHLTLPTICSV
eukprot:845461-Alexandrium_andersonii.AAC.1